MFLKYVGEYRNNDLNNYLNTYFGFVDLQVNLVDGQQWKRNLNFSS